MSQRNTRWRSEFPSNDITGLTTMSEAMEGVVQYYSWIYATLKSHLGNFVLEVGPGYGNFSEFIRRDGKRYLGVDSDENVIGRLKAKFPTTAGIFECGDLTSPEFASTCRQRGIDTLLSMNVLEHVEDDVRHVHYAGRCSPGGRFVLFVPALPLLYGNMDREAGHFRRYTEASLRSVVEKAGLRLKKIFYFNFIGGVAWFVSGRVLGAHLNSGGTNKSILFYDKYVIPVARKIDPIFRMFGGQSLVAVMEIPPEAKNW